MPTTNSHRRLSCQWIHLSYIILTIFSVQRISQACEVLLAPDNGSLSAEEGFGEGATVTFSCNEGYSLIGSPSTTCNNDEYSRPVPSCVLDCSDPGSPMDGSQEGTPTYQAYTTVSFVCDTGFGLVGAPTITCDGGTWTLPVPECVANCADPGVPSSGRQVGNPTYLQGTTVSFECEEGFTLIGASVISCEDGQWDREIPVCAADCSDPGTPADGNQSGSYGNGDTVTFTCDDTFTLVGASIISCVEGVWSDEVPLCYAQCGDPGAFENGLKSGGVEYGDTLTYTCNGGYTLVGASELTCTNSGWDTEAPICYQSCTDPGTPLFGSQSGTYEHGDVVEFACDSGYTLIGASQITCEDGIFSAEAPICQADCSDPGTPENGAQSGTYSNGDIVTFTCDATYTLVGASIITCLGGPWSNNVPECIAACGDPGTIEDGTKSGGVEYGDTLIYLCNDGFTLVGASELTCTSNGWDAEPPVCYSNCEDPGTPQFGSQSGTFDHGDVVTFECNQGYTLIGASQITCDDGSYNANIPECEGGASVSTDSPAGTTQGSKETTVATFTTGEAAITTEPTSKVTRVKGTTNEITRGAATTNEAIVTSKGTTMKDSPATTKQMTTELRETTLGVDVDTTRPDSSTRPTTFFSSRQPSESTSVPKTTLAGAPTTEAGVTTASTTYTARTERETTPLIDTETTRQETSTRSPRTTNSRASTRPLPEGTTRDYTTINILTSSQLITTDDSSPEPPTRPRPICPAILAPNHGSYRRYDWYHRGEKVLFMCNPNYALVGPKWIICVDGEWSGPVPECKITCGRYPPPPRHGYVLPPDRHIPSHPSYWTPRPGFEEMVSVTRAMFPGGMRRNETLGEIFDETGEVDDVPGRLGALNFPNIGIGNPFAGDDEESASASPGATRNSDNGGWGIPIEIIDLPDLEIPFIGGGDIPGDMVTISPGFTLPTVTWEGAYAGDSSNMFPNFGNFQATQVIQQIIDIAMEVDWRVIDSESFVIRILRELFKIFSDLLLTTDWVNGDLSTIKWQNTNMSTLPLPPMLRDGLSLILSTDWQNYDWTSIDFTELAFFDFIKEIMYVITDTDWSMVTDIPGVIASIQRPDFDMGDLSGIDLSRINTTRLSINVDVLRLLGNEFLNGGNLSAADWEAIVASINSNLPTGFPLLRLELRERSLPYIDWSTMNTTAINLNDMNWFNVSLIPRFIRDLSVLLLTTDMEDITADHILPMLPIPLNIREMITVMMNFNWNRLNLTGLNDMPVPSSAYEMITLVTRLLRQNPIELNLFRNYTGMDLANMYNMNLTDMPVINALRPFLSSFGDVKLTNITNVQLLRPYLNILLNTDWSSFDRNNTDFRNMSLPDTIQNALEYMLSYNWDNVKTTVLESMMPASIQHILLISRKLGMTNIETIELVLPLLPCPDYVKDWMEIAIHFNMQGLDIKGINMTTLLPDEWREYLIILMNTDFESISFSNVTDLLLLSEVREFLHFLNATDWSTMDMDNIVSLVMNMDWELPDTFNQSMLQNLEEMFLMFGHIDWESFDWTIENITNLPIPDTISRFLIILMQTDWENFNWDQIDLTSLSIPYEIKSVIFAITNTPWDAVDWTRMLNNLPIPQGNKDFILMLMDVEVQNIISDFLSQLTMVEWINPMPDIEMENIDWAMILDVLNLPISEDVHNLLLLILTSNRENWDTSTLSDQLYEFMYFLESIYWENFDFMQAIDLMNLPLPDQIRSMVMMTEQIDWESFDWMNMDFTVIRELLEGFMGMENIEWSDVIDLSGLPISDQLRMYLEMMMSLDWGSVEWTDVIDLSGLPEPIRSLLHRMMSMDWENVDMTDFPMPDQLREYVMVITRMDWENFDWTQVIDLSGLPIPDQMKLFLQILTNIDWGNMSWEQVDLSMVPMADQVREFLNLVNGLDWQTTDWTQIIDLTGLPISDQTKMFIQELMRVDWENPNWSEMDFSRLPLSEDMRSMLHMMLTTDWNNVEWTKIIDLSGLPISDQMKLAIQWMMRMDWGNTNWMNVQSMMEHFMAFVHRVEFIISDLLPRPFYVMYNKILEFFIRFDLPFLPDLPRPWPPPLAGDSITYVCKRGFELIGTSTLTCRSDGSWNSLPPQCQRIRPTESPRPTEQQKSTDGPSPTETPQPSEPARTTLETTTESEETTQKDATSLQSQTTEESTTERYQGTTSVDEMTTPRSDLQTSEALTSMVVTTEEPSPFPTTPSDPCLLNPCLSDVNTDCISFGNAYQCQCQSGYTRDSNNTCTSTQQFAAVIRITEVNGGTASFTEDLEDKTSSAFQTLAADVENTLDIIYLMSSLSDSYLGATVNGFSNGSIVVDYTIKFREEERTEPTNTTANTTRPTIDSTSVVAAFKQSLEMVVDMGTVNVSIDESSIMISDLDECMSSEDNDCDDNAFCINSEGSFTCRCREGFIDISLNILDRPGRRCALPMTTPTMPPQPPNPCSRNPCAYARADCIVVGRSFKCVCRHGSAFNPDGICELTCGPFPYPPRNGYVIFDDNYPPAMGTQMTPDGMEGNGSTSAWEWPTTRDTFGYEFTTASDIFWRDEIDDSGNFGDAASRIESLNFPNLGVGNPFEETTTSNREPADSGKDGLFGDLPNIEIPNVDIPDLPGVGNLNSGASQVIQQLFDIVMVMDWQNIDLWSVETFQVLRRIFEAVLELIRNIDLASNDITDINWMNMNSSVISDMVPTIDNRTTNLLTIIIRESISSANRSYVNWKEVVDALNLFLPQGLPRIRMSANGRPDFVLDWSTFDMASVSLPDNFMQAITMGMDWQNINWGEITATPEFIRDLIHLFTTTQIEDIGVDDLLRVTPIPDEIRDTITMVMSFDLDRLNMTGINDMPVPSSASELIVIFTRILRQNPIDWNIFRSYTGLNLMDMYNTNMTIPNGLHYFLSDWRNFNMTGNYYVEVIRPYLNLIMNMDWESFDLDNIDLSLPTSFRILELFISTDWENFDTTVLESMMPASIQNFLTIARHLDMSEMEMIEVMLPLLPIPDYLKNWIEMAINFDMQELDVNRMNMTALLPEEWREYMMMLMNMDLESIRLRNITDFIIPSEIREFLLFLNIEDWSTMNMDRMFSLIMNIDWGLPDTLDLSVLQNGREIFQTLRHIDWDNFSWTNENITNLPIPAPAQQFLMMMMGTDWDNISWDQIDLSALSVPEDIRDALFTMMNMRWDAVNWTGMVDTFPVPQSNKDFILMLMEAQTREHVFEMFNELMMMDWENFDWMSALTNMEIRELNWEMMIEFLNLPISDESKSLLLLMLTSSRENWDTTMLPNQFSEFMYFLESIDWENFDFMQTIDLINLPLPDQIGSMLMMMEQIDWESFDWMNMDFTVIRELLEGFMGMENIEWSDVIDLSGLPISEQMQMYLEMLMSLGRENVEWTDVIDLSGLPEPITLLLQRMMSMDWENMDMTDFPMPDQLREYIMMITRMDWENFDRTQFIDLSGLPIPDQMKLFLQTLMNIDWGNMSWEQVDLSMVPMANQVREFLNVVNGLDWQTTDWTQIIDLTGLPISDQTKMFIQELMRVDWENPNWSEMDFSRLPLSEEMRSMLHMMLTTDWNNVEWTKIIDLSGLPISDQMKLAIQWMMKMDWRNTNWMNMDMSGLPILQQILDFNNLINSMDWSNFDWSSVLDLSNLPVPHAFETLIDKLTGFSHAVDVLIHEALHDVHWKIVSFLQWLDWPFLPELPRQTPLAFVGDTAKYVCKDGFKLVGMHVLRCRADGSFSGMRPMCIRIRPTPHPTERPTERPRPTDRPMPSESSRTTSFELTTIDESTTQSYRATSETATPTKPLYPSESPTPSETPEPTPFGATTEAKEATQRATSLPSQTTEESTTEKEEGTTIGDEVTTPIIDFQTTSDGATILVTTDEASPAPTTSSNPCSSNPCLADVNTNCVSVGDTYGCQCQAGYTRDANNTCTSTQQFAAMIRITEVNGGTASFTEDLEDTTSPAFQALAADVESTLDMIYLMSSLSDSYLGATVNGFSNGSIVVDYTVKFREEERTEPTNTTANTTRPTIDSSSVVAAFTESLKMAMEMGTVNVSIDESSVTVIDLNECVSREDNDCDDNAYCINTEGSFTCQCREGFIDISLNIRDRPGKRCVLPVTTPTMPPTPPNPCSRNPCANARAECVVVGRSFKCVCRPGFVFNPEGVCDLTCGPFPHPPRHGYAIIGDNRPPGMRPLTTPTGGSARNESTPGWEWPVTRDLFGDDFTTVSNLWRGEFEDAANISDAASRIESLNFPNLGVGNPFEETTDLQGVTADWENDGIFFDIPTVDVPNSRATHVAQYVIDILMNIDWQNYGLGSQDNLQVIRRVFEAALELMRNLENGDFSNIDWNMNTPDFTDIIPNIDNQTVNLITSIGRRFLSSTNQSDVNLESSIDMLNSFLPQGLPKFRLSFNENGSSYIMLDWSTFDMTILPLPDNFRQTIAMVIDWRNTNWDDITTMPDILRDLILLLTTTEIEDIRVDDLLRVTPIPDEIRDTITMVMSFDLDRLNMTGINDMPVPSSASELIVIFTRILRQNPIDWNIFRNYTGLDLMDMYNTNMTIPNGLHYFLSDWRNFNMTGNYYVEVIRPYLNLIMNMDWESFDLNNIDLRNMTLPSSRLLELFLSTDWENFDTTVLESMMPASIQNFLTIARHLDMSEMEMIEVMLPLLPIPDYLKNWIEMAINFDMQELDVNRMNMTALLPEEWREYMMMLMNMDLESIRLRNITDFIIPSEIREFLLFLNIEDWSTMNMDRMFSLIMNIDWGLPDTLDLSVLQNGREIFQTLRHIDWDNFSWTNENITNLPIPAPAQQFLMMMMGTDWDNISWDQIDLSALSVPEDIRDALFTMMNMRWDAVNWTGMVDTFPVPQSNKDFILMLMEAQTREHVFEMFNELMMMDWENFDWMSALTNMEIRELNWEMMIEFLNLPISDESKSLLLLMLTSSRENWDTTMLPNQFSEFMYFLESIDWETFDFIKAIDLMNIPLPDQIRSMLMMMEQIDWESFDWMNMDFTVIRELLGEFMGMENIEWSDVIDLSGLPISDQLRMYLEMIMSLDWGSVEWTDVIDLSGLPEPIRSLLHRMMSMDWQNVDMTDFPMPDQLIEYIMMITRMDWENFDWTQVIDLSGLPIPDQMKLFLQMLTNIDWGNMSWEQVDLSMVPMADQVREFLKLVIELDWQTTDWTQIIDLTGLPISDQTKMFIQELMRMDWENPNWSEMDFSRLPLSEEMRSMLHMMLTTDWNNVEWTQIIDLSGLPISDQMKLAIQWMMRMDWGNADWVNMDMSGLPILQQIIDFNKLINSMDWSNFDWSSSLDFSNLPIPPAIKTLIDRLSGFSHAVDALINEIYRESFWKLISFLEWLDLPFLPELPKRRPLAFVGDTVKYVCKDGFELIGIHVLRCTADGSFSGMRPICLKIMPTRPPRPPRPTIRPRPTFPTLEQTTGIDITTFDMMISTTEEPRTPGDPCASRPCAWDPNTICVTKDDSFLCLCQAGYSRNSDDICILIQQYVGMIRITNMKGKPVLFTDDLQDRDSFAFRALAMDVENSLNLVYKTSSIASLYVGSDINSFANGSIIAQYDVIFMIPNDPTPRIDPSIIASAFMESLRSAMEMGTLNITIDESSVTVIDFDECGSRRDNDCDDNAFCINTEGSFTCRCLEGFIDLSSNVRDRPGRECYRDMMSPSPTVTYRPTTDFFEETTISAEVTTLDSEYTTIPDLTTKKPQPTDTERPNEITTDGIDIFTTQKSPVTTIQTTLRPERSTIQTTKATTKEVTRMETTFYINIETTDLTDFEATTQPSQTPEMTTEGKMTTVLVTTPQKGKPTTERDVITTRPETTTELTTIEEDQGTTQRSTTQATPSAKMTTEEGIERQTTDGLFKTTDSATTQTRTTQEVSLLPQVTTQIVSTDKVQTTRQSATTESQMSTSFVDTTKAPTTLSETTKSATTLSETTKAATTLSGTTKVATTLSASTTKTSVETTADVTTESKSTDGTTKGTTTTLVTTGAQTKEFTTPVDPCSLNPCVSDVNTDCITSGDSFICECQAGYTRDVNNTCISIQQFTAMIRITEVNGGTANFTEDLQNTTSLAFQTLAADIENTLDMIYMMSALSDTYLGVTINGFSEGSIIVDYTVNFKTEDPVMNVTSNSTSPSSTFINSTLVMTAFMDSLSMAMEMGNIDVTIDEASIMVTDFDECVSSTDNNCDNDASCINIQGSFTCECNIGFIDQSPALPDKPGRLCVAPTTPSVTTANRNMTTSTTPRLPTTTHTTPRPSTTLGDPCSSDPCASVYHSICVVVGTSYRCICRPGFALNNQGRCRPVNQFFGSCRITRFRGVKAAFTLSLSSSSTQEFVALAADIKETLRLIYERSAVASRYINIVVDAFHNGSIVVDYRVELEDENTTLANSSRVSAAFTQSLGESVQNGIVDIEIDEDSIIVNDYNECLSSDDNDCATNAECINTEGSFTCRCNDELIDTSPDPNREPGRSCREPGPCPTDLPNTCSTGAVCMEHAIEGYVCQCMNGYVDVSPFPSLPGRICQENCPDGYCQNGGTCSSSENGSECNCARGYSGPQCEIGPSGDLHALEILGIALGAIIFIVLMVVLTVFCCAIRRQQSRYRDSSKRRGNHAKSRPRFFHDPDWDPIDERSEDSLSNAAYDVAASTSAMMMEDEERSQRIVGAMGQQIPEFESSIHRISNQPVYYAGHHPRLVDMGATEFRTPYVASGDEVGYMDSRYVPGRHSPQISSSVARNPHAIAPTIDRGRKPRHFEGSSTNDAPPPPAPPRPGPAEVEARLRKQERAGKSVSVNLVPIIDPMESP
ncbi:uncharacterized protein LOC129257098 [Lytechinus pictus]|uniref:uncharacterized protein LOC129257098 n=1 Tax=Lytechinus pictus TaxID=7653 RepID=UPI0030B9FD20